MSSYLFTSESVSEGHPDKMADQISDAVLDAILTQDPKARVACETLVKTGAAIVAGEITTSAWVDIESLARGVINDIGYDNSNVGFDGHTCAIVNMIGKQSPDINQGVDRKKPEEQGAGDQGLMFGYACNEAPEFMPAAIYYSHRLVEQQAKVRKNGKLKWLRPDAKSQVTLRYDGNAIVGATIEEQTRLVLQYIGEVLKAQGVEGQVKWTQAAHSEWGSSNATVLTPEISFWRGPDYHYVVVPYSVGDGINNTFCVKLLSVDFEKKTLPEQLNLDFPVQISPTDGQRMWQVGAGESN